MVRAHVMPAVRFLSLSATVVLAGCAARPTELYRTEFAWQHESPDARAVMEAEAPDVVRVTTVAGERFVIEQAELAGDSIAGTVVREDDTPPEQGFRTALQDIVKLEWSHGSERGAGGMELLKGLAVLLGATALVVVGVLLALGTAP